MTTNSMTTNLTITEPPPQWNSKPMFKLPPWAEPLIVLSILLTSMTLTRRRGFQLLRKRKRKYSSATHNLLGRNSSSENPLWLGDIGDDDNQDFCLSSKPCPKRRRCCGLTIYTPDTSRFSDHLHSRILQKFPFLIEMFYWIITYLFYRLTKIVSRKIFDETIIAVAESHGLALLELEQFSWLSFLFPYTEHEFQHWFMDRHQTALTILNRAYALIHIPGTVGFIAWYYYIAPSHYTFAIVRRTLTLMNFLAFVIFTLYPCMPPRLLPRQYGFFDSVRHDNANSVWMSGDYVNSLAAMPSMHFGYSFVIGCTLVHHAGILRGTLEKTELRKSPLEKGIYAAFGIVYPIFVLIAIVATANHYWMDALMAMFVTSIAFLFNTILNTLLVLEDLLLWAIRAEKPVPSTGERFWLPGAT